MSIRTFGSSLLVYFKFSTTLTLSIPGTLRTTGIITFPASARTSSGRLFCAAEVVAAAPRATRKIGRKIGCFIRLLIQFSRRGRRRYFSFHEPNSLSKVHDLDSFESRPATACPAADRLSLFSHDRAAISYATSRPRNHKANHPLE